jgi:dTDP-4-amino-4,6-dideoxygalactose transaminase
MTMRTLRVPFARPDVTDREIDAVAAVLRSGWLTTGPRVREFEESFKASVRSSHALAVNSCTAALHLAVEALGVKPGDAVLVPTMTFAATAEVVRYQGATPVLVDCDPQTLNMDLTDALRKVEQLGSHTPPGRLPWGLTLAGIIPVHVAGLMMDMDAVQELASQWGVWVVEDAAHAFPAAWRQASRDPWQMCGEGTATVTCFSFYANKTMTTGEGGMAVTNHPRLVSRMREMALHGLSSDAWNRYARGGNWDYAIVAPGFKYNLTDIAAAIGIEQLARAEAMRRARERIAARYFEAFQDLDEIDLPATNPHRQHAWHLFPIQLRLHSLRLDRAEFMRELDRLGVATSVHWRPLHLHPYYRDTFGWQPGEFPVATAVWERLVSLPLFSSMTDDEVSAVIEAVTTVCGRFRRTAASLSGREDVEAVS